MPNRQSRTLTTAYPVSDWNEAILAQLRRDRNRITQPRMAVLQLDRDPRGRHSPPKRWWTISIRR